MADLDVSDVLLDPDFADLLTVIRRAETVGDNGRATMGEVMVTPAPVGVVIPQSDSPLVRGPEQQNLPRLIQVHTPFRLRSASTEGGAEFQPDIVFWNGGRYVVNKVQDFGRYGRGFVQADCSSMDAVEPAPS